MLLIQSKLAYTKSNTHSRSSGLEFCLCLRSRQTVIKEKRKTEKLEERNEIRVSFDWVIANRDSLVCR